MNKILIKKWHSYLDKYLSAELIDEELYKKLQMLIDSIDIDSVTLSQELVKVKLREYFTQGLNDDQRKAFDSMIAFVTSSEEDAFVLKGYAGTGKTFLIQKFLDFYLTMLPIHHFVEIGITAPTNKAVNVLSNSLTSDSKLEKLFSYEGSKNYKTIHKFLGLKQTFTDSGQMLFLPDKNEISALNQVRILIVDEVSMLDDNLCELILNNKQETKIIFVGDAAQVPPVNKEDSIPLLDNSKYNFVTSTLNQMMRQAGDNPVVDYSLELRNNLLKPFPAVASTSVNDKGEGIIVLNSVSNKAEIQNYIDTFYNSVDYKDDINYVKILAWTNATVNKMNRIVRNTIFKDKSSNKFLPGERIIANKPILTPRPGKYGMQWGIQFQTSDEFKVLKSEVVKMKQEAAGERFEGFFYKLTVLVQERNYTYSDTIHVLHEDSLSDFKARASELRSTALAKREKSDWARYYEFLNINPDVGYAYAITVHKSQGSSYENAIVFEDDINRNSKIRERNRIKYTACTRVRKKLILIKN
jgi:exodeoxyribonuclease-5